MGTPAFAVPSLRSLIDAGFEVIAAVTQPDKPRGRGLSALPSPVKSAAIEHNIPVFEPQKIREEAFVEQIKAFNPDIIAVVAYGKILPPSILEIPLKGCINVHASLLPKYRGAAPINWAIINGEKETGVCTMVMDKGMDTGPTLLCEKVDIGEDDTAEDLTVRLSRSGGGLLVKTLDLLLEDRIRPVPQDGSKATLAPILKKEDGRIDWNRSAEEIKNLVRGVYPWPGAYTQWKNTLKVHRARVARLEDAQASPGTVVGATKEGILVACGKGVLEITEIQPENKKKMSAADFIKGYRVQEGDKLV